MTITINRPEKHGALRGRTILELCGALERAGDISKHLAMPGNHNAGCEMFDVIQYGLLLGKAALAVNFREDDAEAVFPQSVSRNQDPFGWFKEYDRIGIMPWGAMDLPFRAT